MLVFDGEYLARHPKSKFFLFQLKKREISALKYFIEKPILFDFVNLFATFCPRLQ